MVGTAEKGPLLTPVHLSSWREYVETFGSNTEYTLTKDARDCFQNGVFEVVAIRVIGKGGESASLILKDVAKAKTVELKAKKIGSGGNNITVRVENGTLENTVRMIVSNGESFEVFDNLVMDPSSERYLVNHVNQHSALLSATDLKSPSEFPKNNPAETEDKLKGGKDPGPPSKEDFEAALDRLEAEPYVDMVLACDISDPAIHALIEAHCANMSKEAMGRIGIGTVGKGEDVKDIVKRTEKLSSDRFVLVAPYGVAGAVAGLISRLSYFESPTFKPVRGISDLERNYTPSELRQLLVAGVLPLQAQRGRGIIVVKGITTSKEQISVVRTTDHAVKLVKGIGDMFIGTLNSPSGRTALKEKLTEVLIRMEREGAIVPSADLKEPAFMVDVYCSELDFAQGIVRVDLAVRPVRAIDYIYATIVVQA
ncbi:MAG: phage tail sheath subtilisin-like domain-containing protein [Candidatus Bathyarchaeia archaeon]